VRNNTRLPASPETKATGQQDLQRWLHEFQRCIRKHDYAGAKKLFHANTIGFDTRQGRANSLNDLCEQQWKKSWEFQVGFEFLIQGANLIPAPGLFIIVIEWEAHSTIIGGNRKHGRSTFVLVDFEGKLLCVHSHNSEVA